MKKTKSLPVPLEEEIDLLIDGELPEERREELFARLDGEVHGWKCCATRLLELQVWEAGLEAESRAGSGERRAEVGGRAHLAPYAIVAAAVLGFLAAVSLCPFPDSRGGPFLHRPGAGAGAGAEARDRVCSVPGGRAHGLRPSE